jgi:hypothetical protein
MKISPYEIIPENVIITMDEAAAPPPPPPPPPPKTNKRSKKAPPPECSICCEAYNKSVRSPVVCSYEDCHYAACKTCIRTYLTNTIQEPHCMNCKKPFDDEFMFKNLNKSYCKTEYKEHRRKILFDVEVSKIPETIPAVENFIKIEEYRAINDEIRAEISKLSTDIRRLYVDIDRNVQTIYTLKEATPKKERRDFIMPCTNEDCRGFLSIGYKCEICKNYTCSHCLELIGVDKQMHHECNPDCIKNAEAIKRDTRPCPSCGTRIYKISGCNQIWCVECHVAFNWDTGKIDKGIIHNPHYYEWQKKNGDNVQVARAPQGCIAGPTWWEVTRKLSLSINKYEDYTKRYNNMNIENMNRYVCDMNRYIKNLTRLNRTVEHITNVILPEMRTKIQKLDNHEENRILYILKRITAEEFTTSIYRNTCSKKKLMETFHIYDIISTVGGDFFRTICSKETPIHSSSSIICENNDITRAQTFINGDEKVVLCNTYLKEKDTEIEGFLKYCNGEFQRVSALYNERVMEIITTTTNKNKYDFFYTRFHSAASAGADEGTATATATAATAATNEDIAGIACRTT